MENDTPSCPNQRLPPGWKSGQKLGDCWIKGSGQDEARFPCPLPFPQREGSWEGF